MRITQVVLFSLLLICGQAAHAAPAAKSQLNICVNEAKGTVKSKAKCAAAESLLKPARISKTETYIASVSSEGTLLFGSNGISSGRNDSNNGAGVRGDYFVNIGKDISHCVAHVTKSTYSYGGVNAPVLIAAQPLSATAFRVTTHNFQSVDSSNAENDHGFFITVNCLIQN